MHMQDKYVGMIHYKCLLYKKSMLISALGQAIQTICRNILLPSLTIFSPGNPKLKNPSLGACDRQTLRFNSLSLHTHRELRFNAVMQLL